MRILIVMACALSCFLACQSAPPSHGYDPLEPNPELAQALIDLRNRDQTARGALIESMQNAEAAPNGGRIFDEEGKRAIRAVNELDAESTEFLHAMIESSGWPSFSSVGEDAAHAAWLLVQHADADPALQRHALALMAPLVKAGEADAKDFAYLTDRVRCAQRQPQLFGTQFGNDSDGVNRPFPIEDPAHVDERRKEVGLESLEDYAREVAEAYGAKANAEPLDAFPESGPKD